ncbi:ABC transporter ATP-binding protein [Bacillus aquiflavi]|uniref:ABC transporter ATP-binding protein n=1 Tax=Bacillus aquiflavi TaxID=2672567 RepID=A0A6B3W269_9BACI|nr:ABC transporter ATP-binding protein [Bacillus aquiflavi]MBA4537724.1 ABC transporter ATP-binding protein [Bacillus aquiflavi]NEY81981.1 ABC transporter ATP-binding protein [Bacillus aquiflavi]UAC47602.1 ABC transporter ATP-binding protein [Bacillus aquiflavi]
MVLLTVDIKQAGYEINKMVISNIQFEVKSGELIGLIGPNGAGKSTTIKSIIGLMSHLEGRITFKQNVKYSYIPERPIFYDELTLWEHLDMISTIEELGEQAFQERANELLKTFKLDQHAHKLPTTFSKGMQQKAMLILSLLIKPDVYIIDEPFIGLDPNAMKIFLNVIEEERKRGAGILMSTHVLDTAEKVCDRFLLITNGKLTAKGTLNEVRTQCGLQNGSLYECYHAFSEGDHHV